MDGWYVQVKGYEGLSYYAEDVVSILSSAKWAMSAGRQSD